jgi:DNA-binding LacI/PurR family transcriptional regulator
VVHIGEIALRAGVSRSTVSYALSGKRPVSPSTRARINAVIEEVGYRPSAAARALAAGHTDTIALFVPRRSRRLNSNQLPFVAAVVETAEECGLDVLLSTALPHAGLPSLVRLVTERRVDGVVLMETRTPEPLAEELHRRGAPFVTIGRTGDGLVHDWVDHDQEAAVRACARSLTDQGHRRIALVLGDQETLDINYGLAVYSSAGFRAALDETGAQGEVIACGESFDAGFGLGARLAVSAEAPTGLVIVNDAALVGISVGLTSGGCSVPGDVSIAVVVVPGAAQGVSQLPPLTGVDVPVDAMAGIAVTVLAERLKHPEGPPVQRLIPAPLVDRGSAVPPRPDRRP